MVLESLKLENSSFLSSKKVKHDKSYSFSPATSSFPPKNTYHLFFQVNINQNQTKALQFLFFHPKKARKKPPPPSLQPKRHDPQQVALRRGGPWKQLRGDPELHGRGVDGGVWWVVSSKGGWELFLVTGVWEAFHFLSYFEITSDRHLLSFSKILFWFFATFLQRWLILNFHNRKMRTGPFSGHMNLAQSSNRLGDKAVTTSLQTFCWVRGHVRGERSHAFIRAW